MRERGRERGRGREGGGKEGGGGREGGRREGEGGRERGGRERGGRERGGRERGGRERGREEGGRRGRDGSLDVKTDTLLRMIGYVGMAYIHITDCSRTISIEWTYI